MKVNEYQKKNSNGISRDKNIVANTKYTKNNSQHI
jgi:hypothetical protein